MRSRWRRTDAMLAQPSQAELSVKIDSRTSRRSRTQSFKSATPLVGLVTARSVQIGVGGRKSRARAALRYRPTPRPLTHAAVGDARSTARRALLAPLWPARALALAAPHHGRSRIRETRRERLRVRSEWSPNRWRALQTAAPCQRSKRRKLRRCAGPAARRTARMTSTNALQARFFTCRT